jgi:hypothetical protein
MEQNELENAYFEWMYQMVFPDQNDISYRRLCSYLNNITFYPILAMDENRVQDGEDLRYRFCYQVDSIDPECCTMLDYRPCSVLEMMVALALRIEESIMADPAIGDRRPKWFFEMLVSLGIDDMDDEHFDRQAVTAAVRIFLERKYKPDGRGGLFTIPGCKKDMRTVEIWYQANWYMDSILGYLK